LNPNFRILEILVLVVLPLLIFYLRSSWPKKEVIINVIILPLIWYVFYAPIHELCHILGCLIVGTEIKDYQLFAHFWEGKFGFAFVDIKDGYGENVSTFIILIMPYILDIISIITGYYLLIRYKIKKSFFCGLVLLLLNVRPVYDLIDNFAGYFQNHSDLVMAGRIAGNALTFLFIIVSVITGIILVLFLLKKYKQHPRVIL
jgi:hypothetical protein